MINVQKKQIHKEKLMFVALFSLLLSLAALYMYFLSATVLHVVMQTETDQEINAINSEISELESSFIIAQHKVSSGIASMEGYSEVSSKVFIDRAPDSLALVPNSTR